MPNNKTPDKSKVLVKSNNKRSYCTVDPIALQNAKSDYESGLFTRNEICTKYGINLPNLEKHIERHNWVFGKDLPIIKANIAEHNRRLFEKYGFTDKDGINLIIDGMLKPIVQIFEGKGIKMKAVDVPDYKTRLEYAKEYHKLAGKHPRETPGASPEGDKHLHLHLNSDKPKNPQQTLAAYLAQIRGE